MNFSVDGEVSLSGESGSIVMTEAISFLTILSLTAIFTTVSLFFCGIPICVEIYRRKSTNEISAFPFLMGFLGGSFWLRYGFLRADITMISVNVVGVTLMSMYILFYAYFTRPRTAIIAKITVVLGLICAMLVLVELYGIQIIDPLGFTCMFFNILNFGAPLAGVQVVFKKRCCDTLPLPLCVANLLVSMQWFLYGNLVQDIYIMIPNGAGMALALLQISLFMVFPRQAGSRAPLSSCFSCLDFELDEKPGLDVEKGALENYWLKRNNLCQSSLPPLSRIPRPKKHCLTLIRSTNIFPSGSVTSRTDSTNTSITILPNWSLTPSVSHPELASIPNLIDFSSSASASHSQQAEDQQSQVDGEMEEPSETEAMFNRLQDIEHLDQQWTENELKRAESAPELVDSLPPSESTNALNIR